MTEVWAIFAGFAAAYVTAVVVFGVLIFIGYVRRGPDDICPPEAADPVDEHFNTSAKDEVLDQLEALYARPAYIKEQSNG